MINLHVSVYSVSVYSVYLSVVLVIFTTFLGKSYSAILTPIP